MSHGHPVLAKTNSNTPVGTIAGVKQNTILTATAAMRSAAEYRDVIVAYRNGQQIKLREIANVIDAEAVTRRLGLFSLRIWVRRRRIGSDARYRGSIQGDRACACVEQRIPAEG